MNIKALLVTVVVVVVLVMATLVTLPGFSEPLAKLVVDRIRWGEAKLGPPEKAWEYAKDKIPVPNLRAEVETSGSTAEVKIESDRDCAVFATVTGPLGEQKLADGVVRRFRTTLQELPDGEYEANFLARRCVGLSGKAAEYDSKACQETPQTEEFVIDTKAPEPGEIEIWLEESLVIITGSAEEDLSGLSQACVSKACVAAERGNFELQVPLKVANKHLRKHAAIIVTLIDAEGNRGEAKAYLEKPTEGWILVDGEERLRCIGRDDGGLGGNPPAWTVELLEDGQVVEGSAFGTTPTWYTGVRVVPFLAFLLAIIFWRTRAVLIGLVAGLFDWLADRLEGATVTTEES